MKLFCKFVFLLIILISSCDRMGKKIIMPDGNIYSSPTIKSLKDSGYSVLFLPYSGYSIPSFKNTFFANSYLLLEGDNYYFGECELSEEKNVRGFATILNYPESSMENIVEKLINETFIKNKVLDTKIKGKNKAQIILIDNLVLEIEKEKIIIICKTSKRLK